MSGAPEDNAPALSATPLQIAPGCWMVGRRNPQSLLQCNTYLRIYDEGPKLRVCVDPGSQFDYEVVESNIRALIGDVAEVDAFTLNHQDPDVVGNSAALCAANPRIRTVVTEEVWRLLQHNRLEPGKIHFANATRAPRVDWGEGRHWQLLPTPFCHFRGAMAFYDPEIRTLFTGDLFGGLNQLGRVHLFAEDDDWNGVAQFHQIYMPSRKALRYAVRQIQALRPAVEILAPQHGHVLTGDRVPQFLERVHELLVGCDLLVVELDDNYLKGYRQIVSQMVSWAAETMGREETLSRLTRPDVSDGFEKLVTIEGHQVRVEREGYSAVVKALNRLAEGEPAAVVNEMRSLVLAMCSERGLPIPPIGAGLMESGPM
jgi:eukaryotic-like serine/threonine-protein kinase